MMERRNALGGSVPSRRTKSKEIHLPEDKAYDTASRGSGKQQAATTMAFVRLLKDLMRDKEFGKRVVPIVPDESRTFGMDAFFPTAKIYNPAGQNYLSVDRELVLAYKESPAGQLIHPGINEAGAVAAFTAAGTSYSTHDEPLIPIYVFYSMFGFQRTGDAFWAAGDQMTRGFIMGATAGRTTLTGEGLQHADGHSPILASTNPAVVTYDPAYGYEIGHIVKAGLERMYGGKHEDPNVMYYITIYNEPYQQPKEPEDLDVAGILGGIYQVSPATVDGPRAQLLASGVAVPWTIEAQRILAEDWGVSADVWSVTSWNELRRDGLECEEQAFLRPGRRAAHPVRRTAAGRCHRPGRCRHRLHEGSAGPDPPVRAQRVRHPGRRRVWFLRHPRGGTSLLQDRRALGGCPHPADAGQARRGRCLGTCPGLCQVQARRRNCRHQRQRRRRRLATSGT